MVKGHIRNVNTFDSSFAACCTIWNSKAAFKYILIKKKVVQANKTSKPYQNKILCDYPFLLLCGRGVIRCYLSDIMHLYVLT